MALPEKDTHPTSTPNSTSAIRYTAGLPGASMRNTTIETRAAAPPPTPLNMATIWGMAVIFTIARRRHGDGRANGHGHKGEYQVRGVCAGPAG